MANGNCQVKTLPTWEESEAAIDKQAYTSLHQFVYNWEPGEHDEEWRKDLSELIRDVFASGIELGIEHEKKQPKPITGTGPNLNTL